MPDFDPGPVTAQFVALCRDYPDETTYPVSDFRVEWGPIFHRGRLDHSARVLVIGQDPAQHETICRRILVGEAGQRTQGFLAKAGIDKSYVIINTYVYSVFGQAGGDKHAHDPAISDYRNRWLAALLGPGSHVEVVITLGHLAATAWALFKATPAGVASNVTVVEITHPTFPESSSAHGSTTIPEATKKLLANWNTGLDAVRAAVHTPDVVPVPSGHYGTKFADGDLVAIPAFDLPMGFPSWTRSLLSWAQRTGSTTAEKRATITVTIPASLRPF